MRHTKKTEVQKKKICAEHKFEFKLNSGYILLPATLQKIVKEKKNQNFQTLIFLKNSLHFHLDFSPQQKRRKGRFVANGMELIVL